MVEEDQRTKPEEDQTALSVERDEECDLKMEKKFQG